MDKHLQGLLGAMGALAAAVPAQAASGAPMTVENAMQADSYADLLKPIPNAVALRDALAQQQAEAPAEAQVYNIQYYEHHHHHHHHHRYYRQRDYGGYDHHHHHHHHAYYRRRPGLRIGPVVIR